MYLEVGYNNLAVKLGHFATPFDFEMIPGPGNPFYSHSYCYGYCTPQLVTGVLADWKMTDEFSLYGGFHRGWFQFEDNNDVLDWIVGGKWATTDGGTSIAYGATGGPQDPAGVQDRLMYNLTVQQQLTERLRYVLVHDLGTEQNFMAPGNTVEWYGINQYLLYKLNACWSANLRVEWLRDDDGARIAGPGNIPGVFAWDGFGFAGNFYEISAGLNWRPHPNALIRPEIRWDRYTGATNVLGDLPFDDGNSRDQLTFAADLVVTF
jgi:hypothetical protein